MPDKKDPYLRIRRDYVADILRQNDRLKILIVALILICAISIPANIKSFKNKQPSLLIEHIQKEGFKGVPVTVLRNKTENSGTLQLRETFQAFYSNKTDTIYMYHDYFKNNKTGIKTLWHEYGHHIWFRILNNSERQEYSQIYENSTLFVSKYALEGGCKEDFAESYAYYKTGTKEVPKEKLNFIIRIKKAHPKEV